MLFGEGKKPKIGKWLPSTQPKDNQLITNSLLFSRKFAGKKRNYLPSLRFRTSQSPAGLGLLGTLRRISIGSIEMDPGMDKFQKTLIEIEIEAEELLLARHQMVENDKVRNANREALTALRKRAKTTKSSIPSPFEAIMREMEGSTSRPLVKEVCLLCGRHDSKENTWMMFPSSDIFVSVPFHAAHTILEKDQERLDYEMKKLQSYVKEKSFIISEKGALADRVSPGIVRSMVALADRPR